MFKAKLAHKDHIYHEALHTLLYSYTDGLTAVEIANKLDISASECERLLKIEQIQDTIDADPFTGILIFKSKRTTKPAYSLEEAINMAKRRKNLLGIEFGLTFISSALATFTLVSISLNISLSFGNSGIKWSSGWDSANQSQENLIQSRVEAEIANQKRIELESEKNDLDRRIQHMESVVAKLECSSKYWNQGETCYVEGRLLSQSKFDREIAEMKLQVSKLNEILSLYARNQKNNH